MKKEQNQLSINMNHSTLPSPSSNCHSESLKMATKYVEQQAEQQNNNGSKPVALEKDVTRITYYYTELLKENEKRASRMGLSDEKKKEITAKSPQSNLKETNNYKKFIINTMDKRKST